MNIDWSKAWTSGSPERDQAQLEAHQQQRDALREQQQQPGYIPPGYEGWVVDAVQRLPATHPQRIRLREAQMSGLPFDLQKVLRGDA